jgi:hypothetical protein
MFRDETYLDASGYKLKDYCLRTVRQRIRKLLGDEGVEPEDWKASRSAGLISAPGDRRGASFQMFDAPRGSPLRDVMKERASIRVMFSKDKMARKDLPQLGAMKFGQFNYTSKNVRPQDLSRTAKKTLGNGVRENILPPDYVMFPEEAMTRFRQERGLLRHLNIVRVPRPVIMCQGEVRQAMAAKVQKEEKKVMNEPTTLAGAVRALNKLNDGKVTTAQQRLRDKGTKVLDLSDSSVEIVAEVKGNPERERKPVVRLTPPVLDEVVIPVRQVFEPIRQVVEPVRQVPEPARQVSESVRHVIEPVDKPMDVLDMGDGSDDPDRDRIILQRIKVQLEIDRLAKYETKYALKMENRRRSR